MQDRLACHKTSYLHPLHLGIKGLFVFDGVVAGADGRAPRDRKYKVGGFSLLADEPYVAGGTRQRKTRELRCPQGLGSGSGSGPVSARNVFVTIR